MTHIQPSKEKYQYKLLGCKDLWLLILCISIGSLCLFAFDNFTDLHADELYQAICVRRYNESPLGLLSFWIGHLWTSAFGFTILNLRILASLELVLSVAITSVYSYRMTRDLKLTSVLFLLGCIFLRVGTFSIYNWDVGTYIFDSVSICLLVSFIQSCRWWKALTLGFFIGLMTLGRATSAIMMPLSMVLILFYSYKNKKPFETFLAESLIVCGWICAIILFSTIILGSPQAYISSFKSDNLITGHSDIHVLWGDFALIMLQLPKFWSFGIGCILLSLLITRLKNTSKFWILLAWLIFCIIIQSSYNADYLKIDLDHGVGTPIGIGLLLTLPIFRLFHTDFLINKTSRYCLWGYAILIFSIAFGSDAYVRRMTVGFTLPLIIATIWKIDNFKINEYLKTLMRICLITFGSLLLFQYIYIFSYRNEITHFNHPIFNHLSMKSRFIQEIEDSYEAISRVRMAGIDYAYLGDHLGSELLFGADKGISYQNFQRVLAQKEVWDEEKTNIIPKVEAFIYPVDNKYSDLPIIIDEIKEAGFTDSLLVGQAMILYRKKTIDKTNISN